MSQNPQHVFIVGAKSIGAYGGYETFVNKLTEYHQHCSHIRYHIACKANGDGAMDEAILSNVSDKRYDKNGSVREFTYHNAVCQKIRVPNIGSAQAVFYDLIALWRFCRYIQMNQIPHPIIYILACRIGFFAPLFSLWIHMLGGKLYINPDGHEWQRRKWNRIIRKYWKLSERIMVRYADLVICDSVNIEKYIHENYDGKRFFRKNPATTYIAYGAEVPEDAVQSNSLSNWFMQNSLSAGSYYLIVGRFVPENNYETMIREFMASSTSRSLVIVTNAQGKFLSELEQKLSFHRDDRIRFVHPVYDETLLAAIRQNAFAYLHGHEVGGTNPSLLEAMGTTNLNLLLDVSFNREVADQAAYYWTKEPGVLAAMINACDCMSSTERTDWGSKAKARIRQHYRWQFIADQYQTLFDSSNIT